MGFSTANRGWVYFVGSGPGDPGLLTLRGAELLRQATIVFYDRLVGDVILEHASSDAQLVDVGKEATEGGQTQKRATQHGRVHQRASFASGSTTIVSSIAPIRRRAWEGWISTQSSLPQSA